MQDPGSTGIDDSQLEGYLADHWIASMSGVRLFAAARKTWQGSPHETAVGDLSRAIAADKHELERLIGRLGFRISPVKSVLAQVGAQVSRLSPLNPARTKTGMGGQLELEGLQSAVRGKESLWDTLLVLSEYDSRLDSTELERLKARAQDQQERIAEIMRETTPGRFAK